VKVAALTGITVASGPDITDYFTGEDINIAGLVVNGTYEELGDEPVTVTAENLSGLDRNRNGKQDVVVTYLGKTAKFSVTYVAMSAIKIDTLPGKLEYQNGDEDIDLSGIVVMGTRQGSTTLEMIDASRVKVSGFDKFKAGSQTVTITLGGKTATFKVTVSPNPFVGTWTWINEKESAPQDTVRTTKVTIQMTEDTWTLTETEIQLSGDKSSKDTTYNGTYTRNSGRHADLLEKLNPSMKLTADILSSTLTALKFTGRLINDDTVTFTRQ
jgi:hypothetical protein